MQGSFGRHSLNVLFPLVFEFGIQRHSAASIHSRVIRNKCNFNNCCHPSQTRSQLLKIRTKSARFSRRSLPKNMSTSSAMSMSKFNDWLPETDEVYCRLKSMATEQGGWTESTNTNSGIKPKRELFTRVETDDGPVIHYALFLHEREMRLCGVCQFGLQAQGPPDYVHGGASATMHDSITGVLTHGAIKERCVTASLNVNFKNPTPLRTAILIEASVEKIDGKKIHLKACLKKADGSRVYSDSRALYVSIESKLREIEQRSNGKI
ncbi:acyl-coenzyme A thioesterase THEM4-like [Asterias amurensis]|uniref:acyl-coenzyme A thioesterase THEM4-like n=1 Tax=Asterias amurensis TaxID=7602 RepID=UPI003AB5451B